MGRLSAEAFAEAVADDEVGLRQAIGWHLSANHYPPVPASMIEPCMQAIEAANEGRWDAGIPLPQGVTYRGALSAPVSAMIEQHHLEAWVTYEEDWV
jgi:hypothetical protein